MPSGDITSLLQRLFPGQAIKLKLIRLYVALYGLLLGYLKCYLSMLPPIHKTRSLDVNQALYAPSLPSACSSQELDAENFLLACVDFYLSPSSQERMAELSWALSRGSLNLLLSGGSPD